MNIAKCLGTRTASLILAPVEAIVEMFPKSSNALRAIFSQVGASFNVDYIKNIRLDILHNTFTSPICNNVDPDDYRFGFNGQEKDNEVKGTGNSLDFGARIYDSRLAKFLSIDPMTAKYPGLTPYGFAFNSPIQCIDKMGLEGFKITLHYSEDRKSISHIEVTKDKNIKDGLVMIWGASQGWYRSIECPTYFTGSDVTIYTTDPVNNSTPSTDVSGIATQAQTSVDNLTTICDDLKGHKVQFKGTQEQKIEGVSFQFDYRNAAKLGKKYNISKVMVITALNPNSSYLQEMKIDLLKLGYDVTIKEGSPTGQTLSTGDTNNPTINVQLQLRVNWEGAIFQTFVDKVTNNDSKDKDSIESTDNQPVCR